MIKLFTSYQGYLQSLKMTSKEVPNLLAQQISLISIEDGSSNNAGEVLVKKGSGKIKIRKGQTEEEFQRQKSQFEKEGPTINTESWLDDIDITKIDVNIKSDRLKLESIIRRLYYKSSYSRCLNVTEYALTSFAPISRKNIKNELEELEYIRESCAKKLQYEAKVQ